MYTEPEPLELILTVTRVWQAGQYRFARVQASMASDDPKHGHFGAQLDLPIPFHADWTYGQIEQAALRLAKTLLNEAPLRAALSQEPKQ